MSTPARTTHYLGQDVVGHRAAEVAEAHVDGGHRLAVGTATELALRPMDENASGYVGRAAGVVLQLAMPVFPSPLRVTR
jgi:hypothetical protein